MRKLSKLLLYPRSSLFFEQPAVDTPTQAHTKCPISNINIDRPTPCEGFTFNDADNYTRHSAVLPSRAQGKARLPLVARFGSVS